ncbi:fatty-acid amide hydrolase 2-like [Tropilaelaps mercedesae]|uniref:Fatty-acid amide hydrolase 2-like n=1 Tax=Tropilaelaps mercedesae TaxID=418985 RepID=A0A1V9Y3G8_9ACAR|nr:fatty-acid amide hydrolase 2-like [Tropilaelaps mercedesae]
MALKGVTSLQAPLLRFLIGLLVVMARISDYVLLPLLSIFRASMSKKTVPPIEDRLMLMSAMEIAEKIRTRELTSENVVTAFIKRLRQINPILNAVTDERYRAAIEDAQKVDALIASYAGNGAQLEELKRTKPFLGVPVTTKNALAVKDLGNEAGLYVRRGLKAKEDSAVMASVRASGAIPLAVTNTPELCLWLESSNKLFGTTCNPYDTRRTCGGSSGGEGAILSACGSPIGVGSDIAGSIRIPSFYNGLFGLKPSRHAMNMTGHYPLAKDILAPLLTAGPMCKYACDLRPLLSQIVGPESSRRMALHERPNLADLKVYFMEDTNCPLTPASHAELRRCTLEVARHLASFTNSKASLLPQGKTIRKGLASVTQIYLSYFAKADIPSAAEELTMLKGKISPSRELVKWFLGMSKHNFPAILITILEKAIVGQNDTPVTNYYYNLSKAMEQELDALLESGILVTPTVPDVAPYHDMTLLYPGILGTTGIWNILGFPAVSVPLGLNSRGVPLGVTVVAGKMRDNVCCEVALELEKRFGGWVPPCEVTV